MHHALEIQEILLNVFGRCYPWDMAALARTCHAFKEPALDVLWEVLNDLSPLAQCLPEASHRVCPGNKYSFSRPFTQTEWNTLQSYTRRIRFILDFQSGLDWESVTTFLNPPTTAPLFPNLRYLHCEYTEKSMPLLHLPLPSLVLLYVKFENPQLFQNSLKLFPKFSPNIKTLFIHLIHLEDTFSEIESNYMCRWRNLSSVVCSQVALDVDALVHLSRMPALTRLDFALSASLPTPDSPLVFSNLHCMTLRSEPLELISRLLSQTRLPAITNFTAFIGNRPSRQELTSFLAGVPISNAGHTIERLRLHQSPRRSGNVLRSETLPLGFEDLRPCMAFSNLRYVELNIKCNVGLTDSQVLALASAWPQLEHLQINVDWGWNTIGGITPGGLVQLLQTCRSLRRIALRLDTRGYTEVPPSQAPASLGLTSPPEFLINVLDSVIEAESVPAVTTFFCGMATYCKSHFSFHACTPVMVFSNLGEYTERWDDVHRRVNDVLGRRSESGDPDIQVVLHE